MVTPVAAQKTGILPKKLDLAKQVAYYIPMDRLILVDEDDRVTGYREKDVCHLMPTSLHRAFSVFILNGEGEMLIHKRASGKKTWPGFWTNACCSHPREGETLEEATGRRLSEELGFTCPLTHLFAFRYKAQFDASYGEDEMDHVFVGIYDGEVEPDRDEIEEWKFVSIKDLEKDVKHYPNTYTPWFKLALPSVLEYVRTR